MWNRYGYKINVHLIRHGKTLANEKRLYCGFTDLSLTEEGIAEIKYLKIQNVYQKCDFFICSPLKRAIETLNLIYDNPIFYIDESIREINFGEFEMKSHNELLNNIDYLNWINNTEENLIPKGESKNFFKKRVLVGFFNILNNINNNIKNLALVTHGGVIAIIMDNIFKNEKNFFEWQPSNGRGYIITFNNEISYKKI